MSMAFFKTSGSCVPSWLAWGSELPSILAPESWHPAFTQTGELRSSAKEKCCASGRQGKMERKAGPFLLRGTEQTQRPHNPTTVVMLYLAELCDDRMVPAPQSHAHSHHTALIAHTSSSDGGQPIQVNREEQGLSLLLHLRNCQASPSPQLATDPFLSLGLLHTLSMFSTTVWWVEGEKMGVVWDLSCAVPKPTERKRLKLVTIRLWKHMCLKKTVSRWLLN